MYNKLLVKLYYRNLIPSYPLNSVSNIIKLKTKIKFNYNKILIYYKYLLFKI